MHTATGRSQPKHANGFTLLESLLVMGLLGVLTSLSAMAFGHVLAKQRLRSVADDLFGSLRLAQAQAIRHHQYVSVCRSTNGQQCDTSGTGWDRGWLVFLNENHDSPAEKGEQESILYARHYAAPQVSIRPNQNFTNFITYSPQGLANNLGTFVLCFQQNLAQAQAIVITRARIAWGTDSNGNQIPETIAANDTLTDLESCDKP